MRVFVAMSGGVDSSVAAALLAQEGHDVTGVTMRLQDEDAPGGCCPSGSARDARLVCSTLGIPHYTWDFRDVFSRGVIDDFESEYASGRTPNPCVRCNERVKLGALMRRALAEGADALATGHYARLVDTRDGRRIGRAADGSKDQSYFLYRTTEGQMASLVLPLGDLTKAEVRAMARRLGLASADSRESQDVCFVPDGDVAGFLARRAEDGSRRWRVVDEQRGVLGEQDVPAGLTVGQRFSPGGGPGGRRYVTRIDAASREVRIGPAEALAVSAVRAPEAVWHGGTGRTDGLTAQVRSRGERVLASARLSGGELLVEFEQAVSGAAPGQSVVCWAGDIVVGGGVIEGAA